MAGTDRVYVGQPNRDSLMCDYDRLWALLNMPLVSSLIDMNAATGIVGAVEVPAGAYVYRIQVRGKTTLSGTGSFDVGDGTDDNEFMGTITALAANNILVAPIPAATAAAVHQAGKYYSSADTIDLKIDGTFAAGSTYLEVFYYLPNSPAA